MGYTLDVTGDELNKIINTSYHVPIEDVNDNAFTTGARQSITASSEYAYENNGLLYSCSNFPSHITKLWNTTTNKLEFGEQLNAPVYVANLQINFDPTASSTGVMTIRAYADDGVDTLLQTVLVPFKAVDSRLNAIFTVYLDTLVKTNGVKFTYESSLDGEIYNRSGLFYRT